MTKITNQITLVKVKDGKDGTSSGEVGVYSGTCKSPSSAEIKEVVLNQAIDIVNGVQIFVEFTYANDAEAPKIRLKTADTTIGDDYSIYAGNSLLTTWSLYNWKSGEGVNFIYFNKGWYITTASSANAMAFEDGFLTIYNTEYGSDPSTNTGLKAQLGNTGLNLKVGDNPLAEYTTSGVTLYEVTHDDNSPQDNEVTDDDNSPQDKSYAKFGSITRLGYAGKHPHLTAEKTYLAMNDAEGEYFRVCRKGLMYKAKKDDKTEQWLGISAAGGIGIITDDEYNRITGEENTGDMTIIPTIEIDSTNLIGNSLQNTIDTINDTINTDGGVYNFKSNILPIASLSKIYGATDGIDACVIYASDGDNEKEIANLSEYLNQYPLYKLNTISDYISIDRDGSINEIKWIDYDEKSKSYSIYKTPHSIYLGKCESLSNIDTNIYKSLWIVTKCNGKNLATTAIIKSQIATVWSDDSEDNVKIIMSTNSDQNAITLYTNNSNKTKNLLLHFYYKFSNSDGDLIFEKYNGNDIDNNFNCKIINNYSSDEFYNWEYFEQRISLLPETSLAIKSENIVKIKELKLENSTNPTSYNSVEDNYEDLTGQIKTVASAIGLVDMASNEVSQYKGCYGVDNTTGALVTNFIAANMLQTDAIHSSNVPIDDKDEIIIKNDGTLTSGTYLNLSDGSFHSQNFAISADGNAMFKGELAALSGNIGGFTISNGELLSTNDSGNSNIEVGMSGKLDNADGIILWAGKAKEKDFDNYVSNKTKAPFRVSNTGRLYANSGIIGGIDLSETGISTKGFSLNSDGSFNLANDAIQYSNNKLVIAGTAINFTDTDYDKHISINSEADSIILYGAEKDNKERPSYKTKITTNGMSILDSSDKSKLSIDANGIIVGDVDKFHTVVKNNSIGIYSDSDDSGVTVSSGEVTIQPKNNNSGRNLLQGSQNLDKDPMCSWDANAFVKTTDTINKCLVVKGTFPPQKTSDDAYVDGPDFSLSPTIKNLLVAGDSLTVSFWAKADQENITLWLYFYGDNVNKSVYVDEVQTLLTPANGGAEVTITTEWKRYSVTWILNADQEDFGKIILARLCTNTPKEVCNPAGAIVYLAGYKLEKGNKATDWTPALEDNGYNDEPNCFTISTNNDIPEIRLGDAGNGSNSGTVELDINNLGISMINGGKSLFNINSNGFNFSGAIDAFENHKYFNMNDFFVYDGGGKNKSGDIPPRIVIGPNAGDVMWGIKDKEDWSGLASYSDEALRTKKVNWPDKTGAPLVLGLSSAGIFFWDVNAKKSVMYLSGDNMYITKTQVIQSQYIGDYYWQIRDNGHLTLKLHAINKS